MAADLPTRPSLLLRLRDAEDHAAWSQFVTVYSPLIFAFCRGRGLTEIDSGDVTQDVLRAVAGAIPRFQYDPQRSTFRNWLFTVVRSKLNNFLAGLARRPRLAGDTTIEHYVATEPDAAWEETWQREYRANLVRWAAERIRAEFKSETWNAFWQTAMEGRPGDVVAAELGISLNALYIARSRVTARLKQTVDELEEDASLLEGLAHG